MDSNVRHVKAKTFSAILALIFCISSAQAKESKVDYNFRIVDGTRTTSINISLPKDLDSDFPAPRSLDTLNLNEVDAQKITVDGVQLLNRWSGIFHGPFYDRSSASVGAKIWVIKDPDHESVAELHAKLGKEHERVSKTYRDSKVVTSELVVIGKHQYSHFKIGAREKVEFTEYYVLPLHDGYYLLFLFEYVSNNYKPDINAENLAQAHSDIDQAIQSVSVGESSQ